MNQTVWAVIFFLTWTGTAAYTYWAASSQREEYEKRFPALRENRLQVTVLLVVLAVFLGPFITWYLAARVLWDRYRHPEMYDDDDDIPEHLDNCPACGRDISNEEVAVYSQVVEHNGERAVYLYCEHCVPDLVREQGDEADKAGV